MNDRDRAIIAQVAAKVAGSMCSGKGSEGFTDYLACEELVFNAIIDRVGTAPAAPAPPADPTTQVQAAFPGAEIVFAPGQDATPSAAPAPPAPAAAKPAGRARKKMELDADGFVTDGRQAAWTVAFLCAGQKTDDGKIVVFDNAANKASGKWKANAPDFTISEAGAKAYGLGGERIGLWLSDAPKNIQAGDGSFHPFSEEDMHTRCGV
jgi:hypothetical protein